MSDSAGVTIVTNRRPQWTEAERWRVAMEPELSIGVLSGDEAYEFHDLVGAARQSDGDLVVADARSRTVRLYDRSGVFKRTLGIAGSGPGGFGRPGHVLIGAADSVSIWDGDRWWLTRFRADGEYVEVLTVSPTRIGELAVPPFYPISAIPMSDGTFLVRLAEKAGAVGKMSAGAGKAPPRTGMQSGPLRRPARVLRASADSVVTRPLATLLDTEEVIVESPWGPLPVAPYLARTTSIAVQPNEPRVCIGEQVTTEIRCLEDDGSTAIIRWQADPIEIDAGGATVTQWREATLESFGQKLSRDAANALVARIPIPAFRPPYVGLVLDRAGHAWVERGPSQDTRDGAVEYLVIDRAGTLLGSLDIPRLRIMEIGDDYILGVREDELGVQYLDLYRLNKPVS